MLRPACASIAFVPLLVLAAASIARADVVVEVFDDRAAFEARLGVVRVVDFDDLTTRGKTATPFDADRYADRGCLITAQGGGGQFANRTYGTGSQFKGSSPRNMYAPGPVDGSGNTTVVSFVDGAAPGVVAGFGAVWIDADFPNLAPSSLLVRDAGGQIRGNSGAIAGKNASRLFRGFVAIDTDSGEPVPYFATATLVSGQGWPGVRAFEGVALDDFVFGPPSAIVAAGTLRFAVAATAQLESGGPATIHVQRVGGAAGAVTVDWTVEPVGPGTDEYASAAGQLSFADGQTSASFQVAVPDDLFDEGDETLRLRLLTPSGGAALGGPDTATLLVLDDDACGLADVVTPAGAAYAGRVDLPVLDARRRTLFPRPGMVTAFDTEAAVVTVGKKAIAVRAADVTGDGLADLIVTNAGSHTATVLPGTSGAEFGAASTVDFGKGLRVVLVTDADGDGVADLIGVARGVVEWRRGTGGGAFAPAVTSAGPRGPRAAAVADVDRDGVVDVLVADARGLSVLRGRGDGTFAAPRIVAALRKTVALAVSDLDGDGRVDVAAVVAKDAVALLRGTGTGRFTAGAVVATGRKPAALLARDLDGDGDVDLATADRGARRVTLYLNAGNATFAAGVGVPTAIAPTAVYACDLDGTGALDVVATDLAGGADVVLR